MRVVLALLSGPHSDGFTFRPASPGGSRLGVHSVACDPDTSFYGPQMGALAYAEIGAERTSAYVQAPSAVRCGARWRR